MLNVVIAIAVDFLLILFIAWLVDLPTDDTYYYGENKDEKEKK